MSKAAVKKTKSRDIDQIKREIKAYNVLNGTDYALTDGTDRELERMRIVAYSRQEFMDIVFIALHNSAGFGAERMRRLYKDFEKLFDEVGDLQINDTPDMEYYHDKMEKALQEACGKYYQPRRERYTFTLTDSRGNTYLVEGVD